MDRLVRPRPARRAPGARLVGAPSAAAARSKRRRHRSRPSPKPRCPRARARDRAARGGARAPPAPPARRPCARALRHVPGARRLALPAPDRHAVQLHRARARHLRRPEHARPQARGRRVRGHDLRAQPPLPGALRRHGRGSTSSTPASPRGDACPSGPAPCRRRDPSARCAWRAFRSTRATRSCSTRWRAPRSSSVSRSTSWERARSARSSSAARTRSAWAPGCDFHGSMREDAVRDLLERADLFVLPSIVARDGQMEGVPVVLMEALAAGRAGRRDAPVRHPRAGPRRRDGPPGGAGRRRRAARGARAGRERRLRARPAMPGARRSSASSTWPTARRVSGS